MVDDIAQTSAKDTRKNHKRLRILLIFIVFLSIILGQSVTTVMLESVVSLNESMKWLNQSFMLLSIPFSVLVAGWSDFHCRRKTLIFALSCALVGILLMWGYNQTGLPWLAILALGLKATGGSVIPVALAALADIALKKSFRILLAFAIVAISLGSWIPIYFKSVFSDIATLIEIIAMLAFIGLTLVLIWFRDNQFDDLNFEKNHASLKTFFVFLRQEVCLISIFTCLPMVFTGLLGFTLSETAFYQILLRGELLQNPNYFLFAPLAMGLGYYFGTAILFFFGIKRVHDLTCIKAGILMSFLSMLTLALVNIFEVSNQILIIISIGGFSAGFGLFVPSVFASICQKIHSDDRGKIFGLLDSTDALAVYIASYIIKHSKTIKRYQVDIISLTIFAFSFILLLIFIKVFRRAKVERSS